MTVGEDQMNTHLLASLLVASKWLPFHIRASIVEYAIATPTTISVPHLFKSLECNLRYIFSQPPKQDQNMGFLTKPLLQLILVTEKGRNCLTEKNIITPDRPWAWKQWKKRGCSINEHRLHSPNKYLQGIHFVPAYAIHREGTGKHTMARPKVSQLPIIILITLESGWNLRDSEEECVLPEAPAVLRTMGHMKPKETNLHFMALIRL